MRLQLAVSEPYEEHLIGLIECVCGAGMWASHPAGFLSGTLAVRQLWEVSQYWVGVLVGIYTVMNRALK